eukprot:GHVR01097882.1.p2 GENE.GHVR01097882.1~~GHVR01097882.1.p2  ORF type:complete len:252 (+),score=11.91 GHVR01097882.1:109-864(+)
MPSVSIIGTIGIKRGVRIPRKKVMDKKLLRLMREASERIITEDFGLKWETIDFVGFGGEWADHLPVVLFIKHNAKSLTLYTNCPWDDTANKYDVAGAETPHGSPGARENRRLENFQRDTKNRARPFVEIPKALELGGSIDSTLTSFEDRSAKVAGSDSLIAFTWGKENEPLAGGILDTWVKAKGTRRHVSFFDFVQPNLPRRATVKSVPKTDPAQKTDPKINPEIESEDKQKSEPKKPLKEPNRNKKRFRI